MMGVEKGAAAPLGRRAYIRSREGCFPMIDQPGRVFLVTDSDQPVPGCTVSRSLADGAAGIVRFSLDAGTDISAEAYPIPKLLVAEFGQMEVALPGAALSVPAGSGCVVPAGAPVGVRAVQPVVYLEIEITDKEQSMDENIKPGEVFALSELVPYQEGRIVNRDLVNTNAMKFVVMAFDAGTGLSPHAAPGDALVTALDGKGVIFYEGQEHPIEAGQSFRFAKGGMHAVKAVDERFKMSLLLTLE